MSQTCYYIQSPASSQHCDTVTHSLKAIEKFGICQTFRTIAEAVQDTGMFGLHMYVQPSSMT